MTAGLVTFAKVRALHDATTSPGEKASAAARMEALARKAGLTVAQAVSKLDAPPLKSPAQAAAESFAEFMNRPEFVAERNEREARRRAEAAEIVARYGSEDAVFEDTPEEAAMRAACAPLLGPGETWSTIYRLDGWGSLATRSTMPASVRETIARAWPLPATVAAAWAEFEAADRLMGERCTVEYAYEPHLYVQARWYVLEEILNTLAARSLGDLRARGAWLAFQANAEVSQRPEEHRALVATLRADIERTGQWPRDQREAPVQNGQEGHTGRDAPLTSPNPGTSNGSVYSGHLRQPTRAERHAAIRVLLAEGLADREIARRLAISPTTVGAVRRAAGVAP